jgi:hypothetical protein
MNKTLHFLVVTTLLLSIGVLVGYHIATAIFKGIDIAYTEVDAVEGVTGGSGRYTIYLYTAKLVEIIPSEGFLSHRGYVFDNGNVEFGLFIKPQITMNATYEVYLNDFDHAHRCAYLLTEEGEE